jgi:hypothetical protein
MKKTLILTSLSLSAAALLVGCGSSSTESTATGTFIDAAVEGCSYETSSGLTGTTDAQGRFQYRKGDRVKLHLGNLVLGESTPQEDGLLTPDDISGENSDAKLLILRTLQSLDSDKDPSNGITISKETVEALSDIDTTDIATLTEEELLALDSDVRTTLDENNDGAIDVDETDAVTHYDTSLNTWYTNHGGSETRGNGERNGNGNHGENAHDTNQTTNSATSTLSSLTPELKEALAYMGNEERLAYDVYTYLYNYHIANNGVEVKQLSNIAKAEVKHVQTVQSLVVKYALNSAPENVTKPVASSSVSFEDMPSGEYGIVAIQELYNALVAKGETSKEEALMVGCMVEVTDITDLDEKIEIAQASNAEDIEASFTNLRNASYNHYWAFDKGLKNLGVTNGCYVEGDALLTNKEGVYPTND